MKKVFMILILLIPFKLSFSQESSFAILFEPAAIYSRDEINAAFVLDATVFYEQELNNILFYNFRAGVRFEYPSAHIGSSINVNLNKNIYLLMGFNYYFPLDNRSISNLGMDTRYKLGFGLGVNINEDIFAELTNYNIPNKNNDNFFHIFNVGIGYRF